MENKEKINEIQRDSKGRFIKGHLLGNRFQKGNISWNEGKNYKCKSYNLSEEGKKQKIKNLGSGMIGKKHSEKTKTKISESNKEKIISEKQRKNISETNKNKNISPPVEFWFKKGHKSWNYKGITSLNKLLRNSSKWKIWRELVFLRDNFTCQNKDCQFCDNKIGVMLHPHHKKSLAIYPELAFRVDNGITYCAEFHLKTKLHQGIQKELMCRRGD